MENMDFERALERCGNYGRYQFMLLALYGYTNLMASMHYYSQTLIAFTPEHWCYHQQLRNKTFFELSNIYQTISNPHCTLLQFKDNKFEKAQMGHKCRKWFYNKENNYETITTELNWVCESAYKSAIGQSFYFLGAVVGTMLFGFLADRIGRLPAIILSTITGGLGDFLTSFVNNVQMFALSRFISGLATDTFFVLMYILTFEYLKPKKRTFGLNIITATFYGMGLFLSPWFALWVKSWRYYLLITSVPVLAILLYPLLICESASWLLTREKYDQAVKCLKRVAKFNGRQVEQQVFDDFVKYYKQKYIEQQTATNNDTFWAMFRSPRLRKYTIILLIKSVIITMSFDIISRNMEGLGSSPFKLFSFSSLVYMPAGLTVIALQKVIGRKGMATMSLLFGSLISAVTGLLIAFVDASSNAILLAVMVALGRYGASVAYNAEIQYCTEIVPTSVRGRAVANIHVLGYACSFLNSYVLYLGNFYKPLPSFFISVIMLAGAGLCLCLPETLNQKLPETLSEAELFGLDEKWYFFACLSGRTKHREIPIEENFGRINSLDITDL